MQSAAKPGADDKVGTVAADGHLGSDAGAFFADAEREQGDRLAAERAFVEIEMFLADDMVGVRAAENRAQFLANGNEDGNHWRHAPSLQQAGHRVAWRAVAAAF